MALDIDELLQSSLPSIVEGFKKELSSKISWQVQEQAAKAVTEHTSEWIKTNILPEITTSLVESKEGLIGLGQKMGPAIIDALVASMLDAMKKNLESSYKRDEIFKALFK